jgi:periplasmic divalent cation tolerance protein
MPVVVVLSTFPNPEKAADIAKVVVGEQLAACASLVPTVRSIYRWQGELHDDTETLAILKTSRDRAEQLAARLVALHPYEVPEVVIVPVEGGHAPYLAWVEAT